MSFIKGEKKVFGDDVRKTRIITNHEKYELKKTWQCHINKNLIAGISNACPLDGNCNEQGMIYQAAQRCLHQSVPSLFQATK